MQVTMTGEAQRRQIQILFVLVYCSLYADKIMENQYFVWLSTLSENICCETGTEMGFSGNGRIKSKIR